MKVKVFKKIWTKETPRLSLELSDAEISVYIRKSASLTDAVKKAREDKLTQNIPGIDF